MPFRLDRSTTPILPSVIVPTLPPALDNVILKALAPDPTQRFSTASDFWDAIQAIIYSNHLKPTYSTLQQDHSNSTSQHLAPVSLNSFPAQLEAVADSQMPLIPTPNPISPVGQIVPPQPVNRVNNSNSEIFSPSYSHKIQTNNIEGNDLDEPPTSNKSVSRNRLDSSVQITHRSPDKRSFSSQSRRSRILALLLVTLLCMGGLLASLLHLAPLFSALNLMHNSTTVGYNHPIAGGTGVTITPDSKMVNNSYVILAVPGTPNTNQNQIAARTLSSQQTQTGTVTGTGHNQIPATTAKGSLTFLNGSFASSFTVGTNTPIPAGGTSVYLDVPAVIPATTTAGFGSVTVPAHAAAAGAAGNIAAQTISGTCCVAGGSVQVHNSNAFTGGQDAKDYNFVQPSDVNAFVSTAKAQLTQQANNALKGQLKSGEQLAQAANCPASSQSSNPIGDQGQNIPSTSVTVTVTCKAEALVASLLQKKARADTGSNYAEQGTPLIHSQVQQINADQTVSLIVTARGLWVYQFSSDQKSQLANVLVEHRHPHALVPLRIFRVRNLSSSNLVTLLGAAVASILAFVPTLYLQNVLGFTPLLTGLIFLPAGLGGIAGGQVANWAIHRLGLRGAATLGAGLIALSSVLMATISATSGVVQVTIGYTIAGIGVVSIMITTSIAGTAQLEPEIQGLAVGLLNTSQQIGQAIGLSLASLVAAAVTLVNGGSGKLATTTGYQATLYLTLGFALAAGMLALLTLRGHAAPTMSASVSEAA